MIEDVLAEITAAEARAAQIVADAQSAAREISRASAAQADSIRTDYALQTKQMVKEILAAAESDAKKRASEAEKSAAAEAQALVRAAEKNVRAAGEWLAEQLVKGKF